MPGIRTRYFANMLIVIMTVCATNAWAADFSAGDAAALDVEAEATLAKFKADTTGAEAVLENARGLLVCPKITKAGLGLGAEGGRCVLMPDGAEKTYYGSFGVKGGLIAGFESHSMILALNTNEALAKFTSNDREWELGVDASVAVAQISAGGDLDTTNLKADIVSFIFGQKGLMADVSWEGSRFKKLEIE